MDKKSIALKKLAKYFADPTQCGYSVEKSLCVYQTSEGKCCIAGEAMINPGKFASGAQTIGDILELYDQEEIFISEMVDVFIDDEWTLLQDIHDKFASLHLDPKTSSSEQEVIECINALGLFTYEELVIEAEKLKQKINILFEKEQTPQLDLFDRRVFKFEDGRVFEIGVHPVIFGWRVRGGFVEPGKNHTLYYDVDLCAGPKALDVSVIYSAAVSILTELFNRPEVTTNEDVRNVFPTFSCRPIPNAPEYLDFLNMVGPGDVCRMYVVSINDEQLLKWRNKHIDSL